MNYGEALKTLRQRSGKSQKDLASQTQLRQSYISLLERNERQPSTQVLASLAHALGVPVYLIALMASEREDLRGISVAQAKRLAGNLLELCIQNREHEEPNETSIDASPGGTAGKNSS